MELAYVDQRRLVFPITGTDSATGQAVKPLVYGTAFCVGDGVFLTAGHVIHNVQSDGGAVTLLDLTNDRGAVGHFATDVETVAGCDLGIVACDVPAIGILEWQESPLSFLTDVSAIGYPYAVTLNEEPLQWRVTLRGFKGSIITRTRLWSLPDEHIGYEVSVPFPKGLSGAPVLVHAGAVPLLRLAGIVLGRGHVEIEDEVTEYGNAIDIMSIAAVHSRILGGTIKERREKELSAIREERRQRRRDRRHRR
jgi:hypothetical protein